jgi:hypothetical protein
MRGVGHVLVRASPWFAFDQGEDALPHGFNDVLRADEVGQTTVGAGVRAVVLKLADVAERKAADVVARGSVWAADGGELDQPVW